MADTFSNAQQRRENPERVYADLQFEYPAGVSSAERTAAAAHFQARADEALRLANLAAPPIAAGELMRDYRRRLLHQVQTHCDVAPELRNIRAATLPREVLPIFEKQIIGGAVARFERPVGPLRSCVRRDHAGRETTMWFGDELEAWEAFTFGDKRVRLNRPTGNVEYGVPIEHIGKTTLD